MQLVQNFILYNIYEYDPIQKKISEQPGALKCHVRQNDHFFAFFCSFCFFSADNGLIKKPNIAWYCILNDLSFKTSLEKIGTTFRAIHRGQRSKKVIFGKIHHFLCIFYLKEAVNVLELVYDITMSIIFQVIPVWRRSEQLLDSIWRSKVKKGHFEAKFPIFYVIFYC